MAQNQRTNIVQLNAMRMTNKIHPYIFAGLERRNNYQSLTTLQQLYKAIKTALNTSEVDLSSKSREQSLVDTRHIFHYICVKELGFTNKATAELTKRTHATVLNSVKVINNLVLCDKPDLHFARKFQDVRDNLVFERIRTRN